MKKKKEKSPFKVPVTSDFRSTESPNARDKVDYPKSVLRKKREKHEKIDTLNNGKTDRYILCSSGTGSKRDFSRCRSSRTSRKQRYLRMLVRIYTYLHAATYFRRTIGSGVCEVLKRLARYAHRIIITLIHRTHRRPQKFFQERAKSHIIYYNYN